MTRRTLFIGDVHGCYDELMALLAKVKITDEDHLYFVGDLINKGPKSLEVFEFVRYRPNTWSVIGNHELFTFGLSESSKAVYEKDNPGWIASLEKKSGDLPSLLEGTSHMDWLTSLPTFIERDDFILVHGGLHPEYVLSTSREDATLIRMHNGKPWYESYTGEKLIIYGHWAADGLRVRKNTIGLDTGCCFGGPLTAYCLETGDIWQERAHTVYVESVNGRGKED